MSEDLLDQLKAEWAGVLTVDAEIPRGEDKLAVKIKRMNYAERQKAFRPPKGKTVNDMLIEEIPDRVLDAETGLPLFAVTEGRTKRDIELELKNDVDPAFVRELIDAIARAEGLLEDAPTDEVAAAKEP